MIDTLLSPALMLAASGGGEWGHDGGWWWLFGPLMFLFWIAVIFTFFWFFGRRWRSPEVSATDRARNILAERYARGEITSEEYRDRYDQLH